MNWQPWIGGEIILNYKCYFHMYNNVCGWSVLLMSDIVFGRSFSNFQYFDSKGMFISLVYSIPLLLNTVIIVVRFPIVTSTKMLKHHLTPDSSECLCCTLADGVGIPDLFHYDWVEDTSAQAKITHREAREERLIPLLMSNKGFIWRKN